MPERHVVAQRLPRQAGVTWLVILDRTLDPADPVIKAELQSALTELRAVTGVGDAAGAEPGKPSRDEIPAMVQSRAIAECRCEGAGSPGA